MFKLPNLPTAQAGIHELADFAELWAWDEGKVSEPKILAALGREDENDNNIGAEDNNDRTADGLNEVMIEIERREIACGNGYPFILERPGIVLRYDDRDNMRSDIYRYLLLSTRMNMKDDRVHAGIDGSALLEEVGAHVLQHYLGGTRSRSMVFGTAIQGRFEDKVNNLCRELGEGGCFKNKLALPIDANDERLDAVAWVPFSDKLRSQLVIFGQCKTGTTWDGQTTHLQPDDFIKKWIDVPYLVDPIRAFCISEVAERSRRDGVAVYAGLFLDRCRIVDFCTDLSPGLLTKIRTWSAAAKKAIVIPKKPAKRKKPTAATKKPNAKRRKLRI